MTSSQRRAPTDAPSRRARRALAALVAAPLVVLPVACGPAETPRAGPVTPAGGKRPASTGGIDARALLAPDAARGVVAGAGPLAMVASDVASEGDRIGGFVEVPEGRCAAVVARSSPTIADVDLFAYEEDGDIFVSDESPDASAALVLCPPSPRRLYVAARVVSGAGILGVGVQDLPKSAADAVAKALGARGRPGSETGRLESWPGLETHVVEHRARLGSRWEDVRRVAVPVDPHAPTRVSVPIEARRCLDALAVPGDEVGSFDLTAEDPRGRVIARARDKGRERSIVLCAEEPFEATLVLRPRGTQGLVALVAGRSPVGGEAEIGERVHVDRAGATQELGAAQADLAKSLTGRTFASAKTVAKAAARVGASAAVAIDLPAGCARVDVIAGKPSGGLGVTLWDDTGTLLAEDRGAPLATLFACGPARKARVDVEAVARPGPFAVELRVDKTAPPALVAHPLAAARLLSRLEAAGERVDGSAAALARVVPLEAGKRQSVPLAVAPRGCVEVVGALDGGGAGIELRLASVDSAAGSGASAVGQGQLTRGRLVASDRLCAGSEAAAGVAEVGLRAGKADALVLVRPVP